MSETATIPNNATEDTDSSIQFEQPAGEANVEDIGGSAGGEGDGQPSGEVLPSFQDFLKRGDPNVELPEKGEDKGPTKLSDRFKDKPEDKTAKPKPATPESVLDNKTPTAPVNKHLAARDYSGIDEADKKLFERMSNDAFAKLKPMYAEYKALKQENETLKQEKRSDGLPSSYYEHPKAYTLSPEYETQSLRSNVAQQLEDHWINQLANIEEGKAWRDIVKINPDGSFVYSDEHEITPEARVGVRKALITAQRTNAVEQGKLITLQEGFAQKQKAAVGEVKKLEEQFFPGYDDPKHPTKTLQDEIIKQYPAAFRDHPTTKLLAKTAAALGQTQGLLQAALNKIAVLEGKKADTAKAQPTASNFQGASGKTTPTVRFSDFRNRE